MEITFKLPQDTAAGLVNFLSAQPINTGLTQLVTVLVTQYKDQTESKEEVKND